jgi:hypothetical protein
MTPIFRLIPVVLNTACSLVVFLFSVICHILVERKSHFMCTKSED